MALIYCHGCGKQVHDQATACPSCGAPQRMMRTGNVTSNDGMQYILPIGRSGWAIAAGYLAFFAVLLVPAPFALFCGIMALRDIKKHPEKLGKPRAWFGIVMGVLGCLAIVAGFIVRAVNS